MGIILSSFLKQVYPLSFYIKRFAVPQCDRCSKPRRPSDAYLNERRHSVSAEAGQLGCKRGPIGVATEPKSDETIAHLKAIIKNISLLQELDEETQSQLVAAMERRSVTAGEVIIREGEEGDYFYAVDSGRFVASKGKSTSFDYENGGSFGELALLYNAPRAATVTAASTGVLWALERAAFKALVIGSMKHRRQRNIATLRQTALFADLTDEQRAAIGDCLAMETFKLGEKIISQGDHVTTGSKFYIVHEGRVECFRTATCTDAFVPVRVFGHGDVFGEVALLNLCPRQADCIAATATVTCLTMTRDAFERLMGPLKEKLAKQVMAYASMNANDQDGYSL